MTGEAPEVRSVTRRREEREEEKMRRKRRKRREGRIENCMQIDNDSWYLWDPWYQHDSVCLLLVFLLSERTSGVSSVIFLINRAISYLVVPLLGNLSKFTKRKIKIKRSIREELKKSLEPKSWNEILSCILFCLSLLFSSSWTTVYLSESREWNDDTVRALEVKREKFN